jgi:hypothetical protein
MGHGTFVGLERGWEKTVAFPGLKIETWGTRACREIELELLGSMLAFSDGLSLHSVLSSAGGISRWTNR